MAAALFGAVVWSLAAGTPSRPPARAPAPERRAWWTLVRPLFVGLVVLAFLTGWVLQEPDPADEWIAHELYVVAGLTGFVVLRALRRGWRSLRATARVHLPIATVGMFRCRSVVSEEFRQSASPRVLQAALAHEAAHARSRDPLRIWLTQLACDLQWPVPAARRRFDAWLLALELRRDDEAVAGGASPVDLAEAVLVAARLTSRTQGAGCAAAVASDGRGVALRVRRLLRDGNRTRARHSAGAPGHSGICLTLLLTAVWLGQCYGDTLLVALPGVWR